MRYIPSNSAGYSTPAFARKATARQAGGIGTRSHASYRWAVQLVVVVAMMLAFTGSKAASAAQSPTGTGALLFYDAVSGEGATARLDTAV